MASPNVKMMLRHIAWLWANSVGVCGGSGIVLTTRRIRFLARSLAVYSSIKSIIDAPEESPLAKLMQHRPETVGVVIWPYQCSGWNVWMRIARIRDHYAVAEKKGGIVNLPVTARLPLLDLREIYQGFHVILDQPKWFMREGQLTINLFIDDTRMYSLVFSLFHHAGESAAFIGAIQGRDLEGVVDRYRELTKACCGMRPRDFLIEIFRMLCAALDVRHIFAVSDHYRLYRSRYFGDAAAKMVNVNYDEIWSERGGVPESPMYYRLDVEAHQRDLNAMPAKKRGMYRKRYLMLHELMRKMRENCRNLAAELVFENQEREPTLSRGTGP